MEETGQDRLAAAGATAHLVGGLDDGDPHVLPGQQDGGGESVGPAAHHHGRTHAGVLTSEAVPSATCRADQVTWYGIGPSGSHGCAFTASATRQVPRSITPRAASMTL